MAGNAIERQPFSRARSRHFRWQDASCSTSFSFPLYIGPTAWNTHLAGSFPAPVATADPGGHFPIRRHSSRIEGPPARWIAPSTPPPPARELFAALTIASAETWVMSPRRNSMEVGIVHRVDG